MSFILTSAFSLWGRQSVKPGLCGHRSAWVQWTTAFSFQNCSEASPRSSEKASSGIFREHGRRRCFASFLFSLSVQVVPAFTAGRKSRMWSACRLAVGLAPVLSRASDPAQSSGNRRGARRAQRGRSSLCRHFYSWYLASKKTLKVPAPLWSLGTGTGVGV